MDLESDEIDDLKRYLNEIEKLEDSEVTDEINELKDDINEMIKLKSDELLEQKRNQALSKLESFVSKEDDLTGQIIGINFVYNNGSYGLRNATVIDKIYQDNGFLYKVIYSYPIYANEQPCKFVMSYGFCNKEFCRYNHGIEVESDKILDAVDYPLIEGSTCLVQLELDDLWVRARILHVDHMQDTFVVELIDRIGSQLDHTYNVSRHQIVGHKDSSLDSNDKSSDDDSDVVITDMYTSKSNSNVKFGNWEAHTRGIGLKLLMKMGYQMGTGLGVNHQGRVSPVRVAADLISKKRKRGNNIVPKVKEPSPVVDQESISGIKTAIVRNHDKIESIRDNIDQLEKVKRRNHCDKTVTKAAEDRIEKLKLKMADLEKDERSLIKKQSKKCPKKKLHIF